MSHEELGLDHQAEITLLEDRADVVVQLTCSALLWLPISRGLPPAEAHLVAERLMDPAPMSIGGPRPTLI